MTDRYEFPTGRLPEPLERLDAELSSIRYEERPSFAPELEAELAREWQALQGRSRRPVRELLAAGLAALLLVGMGVPSARAALVRFAEALGVVQPRVEAVPPAGEPTPVVLPARQGGLEPEDGLPAGAPPPAPRALEAPLGSHRDRPMGDAETSVPELLDRGWVERVIRRHYPMSLQRAGIGGVVGLLLWVDSAGSVGFVNLGSSSGVPDLDRAALQVAPSLRFEAARRGGRSVGTWVEFDVRFEPAGEGLEPDWLSGLAPLGGPTYRAGEVAGTGAPAAPGSLTAEDFLRSALGDEAAWVHLGPAAAILAGDVPPGRGPTEWRGEVSRVLLDAMEGSPDNPAPFLALARLRLRQGLRSEAQILLERGIQHAQRGRDAVPPRILADLHFERGLLSRGNWEVARWRGRVRSNVMNPAACPDAPTWGGGGAGFVPAETLLAWNYLCPEALEVILSRSFESLEADAAVDRALTLTSFRAAVEAYPAHPEANVAMLLGLAEEGRWEDLLRGARRFLAAWEDDGHGLLLEGLALQRLSRSEEAQRAFEAALARLSGSEAAAMWDIAPILLDPEASEYARLPRERQAAWAEAFWRPLDPILATPVNEREVEHLARASFALLRFGSVSSDAGEVVLRYGHPRAIRAVDDGPGVRMELWDFGPGPDLTFRHLAGSPTPVLTPEGRAYLNEVRELVPHRYGSASRPVFALQAQVARFRGNGEGVQDVEVFSQVPVAFATGPSDSVEVSLVLLGAGGSTLSVTRSRVAAEEGGVMIEATARSELRGVVVEMYSPRTGQAAALRCPLDPQRGAAPHAVSDLVLTEVATPPTADVYRGTPWMEPLPADRPVAEHIIGAFLEVYGAAAAGRYRLRAELEDRTTGEVREVPIQPAQASGFRPTWERRARAGAVTPEYVTVWLGDVQPGRYALRLVVSIPGAGVPLVAEQALDRR